MFVIFFIKVVVTHNFIKITFNISFTYILSGEFHNYKNLYVFSSFN